MNGTTRPERNITLHHDGHGLNEAITVAADELGPGGASHRYLLAISVTEQTAAQVGLL